MGNVRGWGLHTCSMLAPAETGRVQPTCSMMAQAKKARAEHNMMVPGRPGRGKHTCSTRAPAQHDGTRKDRKRKAHVKHESTRKGRKGQAHLQHDGTSIARVDEAARLELKSSGHVVEAEHKDGQDAALCGVEPCPQLSLGVPGIPRGVAGVLHSNEQSIQVGAQGQHTSI